MGKKNNRFFMDGAGTGLMGLVLSICLFVPAFAATADYEDAVSLGHSASDQARRMLNVEWPASGVIVVTNAGYAMPGEHSTKGCLDGISDATGATVGSSTLLTLQSRFDQPLWFAFFVRKTGQCAYLEYKTDVVAKVLGGVETEVKNTVVSQVARIDAKYLFAHPDEFSAALKKGLFGRNAFRIVTTVNAAARNCGSDILKAVQVHDHFCPGVTSGIVMANYIRHRLLQSPNTNCFVLSLTPWCKEDALTSLLNATPGKRAYGVLYPTKKQQAAWPEPLNKVCTVIFTQQKGQPWHGHMLGFDFAQAKKAYGTKSFGNSVLDKLHADIWFLENMERAESLVQPLKDFTLASGKTPKTLLQPGVDLIGLLQKM